MSSSVPSLVTPADQSLPIIGIGHIAVAVSDLDAARDFYCGALGFIDGGADSIPGCGRHRVVTASSGQRVALAVDAALPPADTGIHQAYRASPSAKAEILGRLKARKVAVATYREDRPAEQHDNCYLLDPFGNRIQLVTGKEDSSDKALISAIDHVGVQCDDIEWMEMLYVGRFGMPMDHLVGASTADYERATAWGEGKEKMAPGTRRWDKRFYVAPGQTPLVARPNMQFFVRAGRDVFGVFLATKHDQEPPEELIVGCPRTSFIVPAAELDRIADLVRDFRLPMIGPVKHPVSVGWAFSLYFRDRGANFIEFRTP
jgi:catechol 2,3-dioxygenase-like lactoylglutathione lyase family enzyme